MQAHLKRFLGEVYINAVTGNIDDQDRTFIGQLVHRMDLTARFDDDKKIWDAYVTVLAQDCLCVDHERLLEITDEFWEKTEEERDRNLTPH